MKKGFYQDVSHTHTLTLITFVFPLFVVLVFGVLVFVQCNFLFTTELLNPITVLLLLAGPHWPYREAGDSGAEGLGASGLGVGSQGAGGLGAGAQ